MAPTTWQGGTRARRDPKSGQRFADSGTITDHLKTPATASTVRGLWSFLWLERSDMANASRIKLHDVLASECSHPTCYAAASETFATPVPLCELHILQVYKAVNRRLVVMKSRDQEYALLPLESERIDGPCPSCGHTGYLWVSAGSDVFCRNDSCGYTAPDEDFRKLRREALFAMAGRNSVVYYVKLQGLVKIGTTQNLRERYGPLIADDLLGYELGGYDLEARRHKQFADYRDHHEWFQYVPTLSKHINKVTAFAA